MVGRVGLRQELRIPPLAGQEHALPRHEHVFEDDDSGGLPVSGAERRIGLPRPPRRTGDDGEPVGVHRHRAADGEGCVRLGHVAAGHDEELVHVGRAGDDRLGAADDDAARPAPGDVYIGIPGRLPVGTARAVALAIGHGDAQGEVFRLDSVEIVEKAPVQVAPGFGVDPVGRLVDGVEAVLRQVALGTARVLADEAHRLELAQLVVGRAVDVEEAVDRRARALLDRRHRIPVVLRAREVVGQPDGGDAWREARLVGDGFDRRAVEPDPRRRAPERLPVILGGHEHPTPLRPPAVPGTGWPP